MKRRREGGGREGREGGEENNKGSPCQPTGLTYFLTQNDEMIDN